MAGRAEEPGFRVPAMYHPSLDVTDLEDAERWYLKVFGAESKSLQSLLAKLPPRPGSGYPPNYSTFTLIGDVLMDTIDPKRYVFEGVQRLPSVSAPHLRLISWYLDDMDEGFRALRSQGIRITSQLDEIVEGDAAPVAFGSDMKQFYTHPCDAGLRYAFSLPAAVAASDPRSRPGWALAPSANDPLGLDCCSYHTILTDRPGRQLKVLVDALGGAVFQEGRNPLRGTDSIWLHLGDATIELAIPVEGTAAHIDWRQRAPLDTYHAITWKVADLDRAEAHLASRGVQIAFRGGDGFITDPATSLGIPWGFVRELVPGDPRLPA